MTTELLITIIIAIVGWLLAIAQFIYKREWQKKDQLAARRYDAYSGYMRKLEQINENIRKDPKAIFDIVIDFIAKITTGNEVEISNASVEFNKQVLDYLKRIMASISIINQESTPIYLIASDELLEKLKEQKRLITDYSNEVGNYLNAVNVKDGNTFQPLTTLGQDARWKRFTSLNDEIIALMRKEINVE